MEKTKRALEVNRHAFLRIYNAVCQMLKEDSCDILEVQANIRILDEKIACISDLSQLLFDLMLSSDDDDDYRETLDALMESNDKMTCDYHKLKLQVEQICSNDNRNSDSKSSASKNKLRLPKIELKKFGGDLKDWLPFWSQFRRIDEDSDMEDEDKFQYLLQSMIPDSRARQLVESYPATSENYSKVIKSLKTRFGRKDLLVEVYVRELIKLVLCNLGNKNKLSLFYDTIESQLRALETLEVTSDTCAAILYPLVESCLGEDLIRAWQRSLFYIDSSSLKERLNKLMEFLKKEVESEDRISLAISGFENNKFKEKKKDELNKILIPTAADLMNKNYLKCVFCQGPHTSCECNEAKKWPFEKKKKVLYENGCCHLCLKFGHIARKCRVQITCSNCHRKHATIICPIESSVSSATEDTEKSSSTEQSLSNHTYPEVFLQTLAVELKGERKSHRVRVIFDSGSHRSYITSSLAEDMGYDVIRQEQLIHSLFGGMLTETVDHNCYRIRIKSLTEDYSCNFEALSQSVICNNVSSIRSGSWLTELKKMNIEITDTEEKPIDILIGADIFGKLLTGKKCELECGLTAVHTLLGWTLVGKIRTKETVHKYSSMVINSMFSNDVAITKLWSLDVLGIQDPQEYNTLKENERLVMEHFLATVKRREDGRYEVDMPWIANHPPVPTNYDLAERRLNGVIKKLHTDGYYDDYYQIFTDWLEEEIIEQIPSENAKSTGYFLPHHPVVKLSSTTTKIRPVFDATAHERKQPSLNQCLEKGSNLIELIPDILIRFRTHKFGVIADIRKAFLQIGLNPSDRDFLKFIWYDRQHNIKFFQHARVVFGITCSPFLLGAVLEYHLENALQMSLSGKSHYSSKIIVKLLKAFYVDNVIASVDNENELNEFMDEASKLLMEGQFDLRGWEYTLQENLSTETDFLSLVLGLVWNRSLDTLQISLEWIKQLNVGKITKRTILSAAHKLFDPIGFISPVTLYPKLLLQKICMLKLSWDAEVEGEIKNDFLKWLNEIPHLAQIKIPRWFLTSSDIKIWTLHVFCDASKDAYATSIFLRSESNTSVNVSFIQAKSRVAPLKKLSIPRLELLAANIGARLSQRVIRNIDPGIECYFWTDSSTVLSWIKREEQWKPFVWNRVEEIRKLTNKDYWFYVPSEENPADLPSRGCFAKKLANGRWWEGPLWLQKSVDEWYGRKYDCNEEIINHEKKKTVISSLCINKKDFTWYYSYFSSYYKIIRLIGWIKRFVNTCKRDKSDRSHDLTVSELDSAEKIVIKLVQKESFPQLIEDSKLSTLCPLIDDDGIIRIRTKISDRQDIMNFRFPYVLPANHEVVNRLILAEHVKNCHAGVQCLMSILRERFWIIKCRRTVKSVVRKCVVCKRFNGKNLETIPIPLPIDRVREAAIFEVVGIDLAGPLYVKSGEKVWIVLYTCAVYRAIHLELVSSLSTNAFLQSFRRFVSRRGRPTTIYSDNAKNFVGAENAFQSLDWKEIIQKTTIQKIEWKFNPPTAAWWGGWWERLIRLVKDLLRRVLGKSHLSMEELSTILCECEAVINSRPLTFLSEDSSDLATLTPMMFLQEISQNDVTDINMVEAEDLRNRYKYRLKLKEILRVRFRTEYLGQLALFTKKKRYEDRLEVGDVVFVTSENQKKIEWFLGRIETLIPGRDGHVRLVKLKTLNGKLLRPIQRICPLEIEKNDSYFPNKIELEKQQKQLDKTADVTVCDSKKNETMTRSGRRVKLPQRYQY